MRKSAFFFDFDSLPLALRGQGLRPLNPWADAPRDTVSAPPVAIFMITNAGYRPDIRTIS